MYDIQVGTITADERVLHKGFISLGYINADLKTPEMEVLRPVLDVHMGGLAAGSDWWERVNYMYIPAFGRYYFVRHKVLSGRRVQLVGEVDVLMSWSGTIAGLSALLIRTEEGADYTPDSAYPLYPYKEIKVAELEGGDFNIESADGLSYNYVLNVAGGGASG